MLIVAKKLLERAQPFYGHLDPNHFVAERATSRDLTTVEQIVHLAYNWRYSQKDDYVVPASFQEIVRAPNSVTLVVKAVLGRRRLILGTARLTQSENLEIFSFFDLPTGQLWPHQEKNLLPYEIERLAFHPLLDLESNLTLKKAVVQALFKVLPRFMPQENSWLGVTMRANVAQFITAAGIPFHRLETAKFAHNQVTDKFVKIHPRYFTDIAAYEIEIK